MSNRQEVIRDDYVHEFEDEGGVFPVDLLPLDEWTCAECGDPVGYVTYDTNESTGISWNVAYADGDALADGTKFYCADCYQGEPNSP